MKKLLFYTFFALVAFGLGSCQKSAQKIAQKIKIEGVEKFEIRGVSGAAIDLRINNGSGYKLALNKARLDVYFGNSKVINIQLRAGVEIPRRTIASIQTQWQMRINDPLAMFVLAKKFEQREMEQISVSFDIEAKGGPKRVNISRARMPLSEFLNIFGLSINDITNYLK